MLECAGFAACKKFDFCHCICQKCIRFRSTSSARCCRKATFHECGRVLCQTAIFQRQDRMHLQSADMGIPYVGYKTALLSQFGFFPFYTGGEFIFLSIFVQAVLPACRQMVDFLQNILHRKQKKQGMKGKGVVSLRGNSSECQKSGGAGGTAAHSIIAGTTAVVPAQSVKKGVVSLKRGNSFWVQKKHSDYENPNACGRM